MALGLHLRYPELNSALKSSASAATPETFFEALRTETRLVGESCREWDHRLNSIYVGGATPQADQIPELRDWLHLTRDYFLWPESLELSIQIAPERDGRGLLESLKTLGITRLEIRVGSFRAELLAVLGQYCTTSQVHEAIYLSNVLGFGSFGCDLIFGFPEQTAKMLTEDLDRLVDLEPPHISVKRWRRESGPAVDSGFVDTLGKAIAEHLGECDYEEYASGRFACPGHRCRYHADRAAGGDYIGLGPGARSLLAGTATANAPGLANYIEVLGTGRRPAHGGQ